MGFWEADAKKAPGPEKLGEEGWWKELRGLGMDIAKRGTQYPKLGVPGMTGLQQQAFGGEGSMLAQLFSGMDFQDPRTSPLYEGLREQMMQEEQTGIEQMRRFAAKGGMLRSSPAMRTEGDYRSKMSAQRMGILGGLHEAERSRDNLYNRLAAAAAYGEIPRRIEQEQSAAKFAQQFGQAQMPMREQLPALMGVMEGGAPTWYQPQWYQESSGLEKLMSIISGVVMPMAGLFGQGPMAAPKAPKQDSGGSFGFGGQFGPFTAQYAT